MDESTSNPQNVNEDKRPIVPANRRRVGYYPETFISFSLPYRAPVVRTADGEKTAVPSLVWERRNGNFILSMTAGAVTTVDKEGKEHREFVMPSGKYSRLVLHWLCSEAIAAGGPEIELSTSWKGFLNAFHLTWSPKTAREVERQLRALLALRLESTTITPAEEGTNIRTISCVVGKDVDLTFTQDGALDDRKSRIVLSQEFWEQVVTLWPVPHNKKLWDQLVASTKSPLTLDVFLWLSHRLHRIEGADIGKSPVLSWDSLASQFGADGRVKKFREAFIKASREIEAIDPQLIARVERVDAPGKRNALTGIRLHLKKDVGKGYKNIVS